MRARDDRKLVAHAIYRDKHVGPQGKGDDDDPRQDGRGAMTRDKGVCSFEWAIPLDSSDSDDLPASSPAIRFVSTCHISTRFSSRSRKPGWAESMVSSSTARTPGEHSGSRPT